MSDTEKEEARKASNREKSARYRARNPDKGREYMAAKRAANPEESRRIGREQANKWRKANPEKTAVRKAKYQANNRDKIKQYGVAYHVANAEKIRARVTTWQKANPEKAKANSVKWKAAHPESLRLNGHTRRAREFGGRLSKGLAHKLYVLQSGKCACCYGHLREIYDLDHIMPLALGGLNEDRNIQLLHPECNGKKHAKHPIDFMQSLGFLL